MVMSFALYLVSLLLVGDDACPCVVIILVVMMSDDHNGVGDDACVDDHSDGVGDQADGAYQNGGVDHNDEW